MAWIELSDIGQIDSLIEESKTQTVLIYKHSTRCSISSMVLERLDRTWTSEGHDIKPYYLDLITFRDISNAVADRFGIYHESPQVIMLKDGKATYDASHMSISFAAIKDQA
ncbi:MAG: bacillithiol system redox-active protein YtxJ [Roseivirga sp.]